MKRPLQILLGVAVLWAWPVAASAQFNPRVEGLCDTQHTDCRDPILDLIRKETQGIDVAFWFMQDARYRQELINRHNAVPRVPIRILVDLQADSKPGNTEIVNDLAAAGIPIRHRAVGDILHFKMMLFHGQGVLQFSKANYTPYSFVPVSPTNYFDETIFFTNDVADLALMNSFRRRFDDLWIDTSRYQNYRNITGTPTRRYAPFDIDPSMNFPPRRLPDGSVENFQTRAFGRFNAENQGIDAIVYRITDSLLPNALIDAATKRNVRVRVISEPQQYRDPAKRWHAAHMDRMYMAGVQIKHRYYDGVNYAGLMHQGSVVLHGLGEVIFGSSNWTSASANRQDEHNYFYKPVPGKEKLWFFQFFADQFENKFTRDTLNNYVPFVPKPPSPMPSPDAFYVSPGNGASGVSTSATLTWEGGPWAHLYDIYLGTSPTALALIGPQNQQLGSPDDGRREAIALTNLQPGTTYFWRIVSKTWALQSRTGPVWSFTTAGTSPGGGGGGMPYGGTPATIPGTFQAENFDEGGQFVGSYDTTAGNKGATYRNNTDVDIGTTNDGGTAIYVGWTRPGEWLKYTVNVATAGTYSLQTRLAQVGTGGRFHLEVGTTYVSGSITVPNTGAWDAWQTITTPGIQLPAGVTTIRVVLDAAGTGGAVAGFNWFRLTSGSTQSSSTTTPYGGTAAVIPGFVQAENFDEGGQSVGHFDTTAGNKGAYYRLNTDVDIGQTNDGGTAAYVGWTRPGEWLKYTVNVQAAGTYSLETRLAQVGTGGRFHIEVGTSYVSGAITVPDTGAWDAWQTITTPGIQLPAGVTTIRVVLDAVGTGGAVAGFNWFQFIGPTP